MKIPCPVCATRPAAPATGLETAPTTPFVMPNMRAVMYCAGVRDGFSTACIGWSISPATAPRRLIPKPVRPCFRPLPSPSGCWRYFTSIFRIICSLSNEAQSRFRETLSARFVTEVMVPAEIPAMQDDAPLAMPEIEARKPNQSINWPSEQSTNQPINQSIDRPNNQSINQSRNQSINQSIDQSINQSIDNAKKSRTANKGTNLVKMTPDPHAANQTVAQTNPRSPTWKSAANSWDYPANPSSQWPSPLASTFLAHNAGRWNSALPSSWSSRRCSQSHWRRAGFDSGRQTFSALRARINKRPRGQCGYAQWWRGWRSLGCDGRVPNRPRPWRGCFGCRKLAALQRPIKQEREKCQSVGVSGTRGCPPRNMPGVRWRRECSPAPAIPNSAYTKPQKEEKSIFFPSIIMKNFYIFDFGKKFPSYLCHFHSMKQSINASLQCHLQSIRQSINASIGGLKLFDIHRIVGLVDWLILRCRKNGLLGRKTWTS